MVLLKFFFMESLLLLFTLIVNIGFTLVMIRRLDGKKYKLFFTFLLISVAAWSGAMFAFRILSPGVAVFWFARIVYFAAASTAFFFLLFSNYFSDGKSFLKKLTLSLLGVFYVLVSLSSLFSSFIIQNIGSQEGVNYLIYNFWGNIVYGFYILLFYSLGAAILIVKYRKSEGQIRAQLQFIILGMTSSGAIGFFNNFILTSQGDFSYNWIGPSSTLIMVACIAYAIIKHRLMDIRVVMRRYLVYALSLLSVILPGILIKSFINVSYPEAALWSDYAIIIVAVSLFPYLRDRYYVFANKYFFSSLYDDRELISELSDKLGSTLRIKRLYLYVITILKKAFHTRAMAFLIHKRGTKSFVISYRKGVERLTPKTFEVTRACVRLLSKSEHPIVISDLKKTDYVKHKKFIDIMRGWKMEVVVPLSIRKRLVGLLLLSEKESRDPYNDTDLRVLDIISVQTALAINNSLSYERIKHFNIELEKEVEEATQELREANKKLKKLDAAKSEFVSIASHQLRTPLTVIKGYISMMLEGSFGRVPKKQKESLERVAESNERLIQLVENLLNISRIESGRLRFNFELVKMEDMVVSVVEELSSQAKKKGIKMVYDIPSKSLQAIMLDREKIRQVVMNLVDNAIKYTNEGEVKVQLQKIDDEIQFSVSDNGMGISDDDLPNLFTKFTRGTDTPLIHTEGTGLGLYVARQMIEAHQGRIWAKSRGVGEGSAFCFTLPLKRAKKKYVLKNK